LLREIRAAQDVHSADLAHVKGRLDDLYKIPTHTLGVAANAHVRYEELERRVEPLTTRIERLEGRH
jgi:hypothetical protein